MGFNEEQQELCARLVEITNDITGLLNQAGEEVSRYKSLSKIKNTAKHRDPNGIPKIAGYLEGLKTVLSDNRAFNTAIGRKLDEAHSIAAKLEWLAFHSNEMSDSNNDE